jgi:hypothetical protein
MIPGESMSKGLLMALSNPISPDREQEFNDWYDNIHTAEVTSLPGIVAVTRYRTIVQLSPPAEQPAYRYLAIYELDDINTAVHALQNATSQLNMSDSMDLQAAQVMAYETVAPRSGRAGE